MRPELVERLLTAAQDVVNDADVCDGDHGEGVHTVGSDILADLRAVVVTISNEAWDEIQRIQREVRQ